MVSTNKFNQLVFNDMINHLYNKCINREEIVGTIDFLREKQVALETHWLVEFDFENIDGVSNYFSRTIGAMHDDWWGDCEYVPSNDTWISHVSIICNAPYKHWMLKSEQLSFGDFMEAVRRAFNLGDK